MADPTSEPNSPDQPAPAGGPGAAGAECSEPDCSDAVAELYSYLDGQLDDERRSLIKGHLDSCSPCFEAFDFEADLRNVIATKCKEEVPQDLRRRIEEAIGREG